MRLILNPTYFLNYRAPLTNNRRMNLLTQASCGDFYCCYRFLNLYCCVFVFPNKSLWRQSVALVMKASFGEGFCKKQAVRNVIFVLCTFALR